MSELREAMWNAIAEIRDASPRLNNDAATDDIVDALLSVVAVELRRLADEVMPVSGIAAQHLAHHAAELDPSNGQ